MTILREIISDESGQGLAEYSLILSLIALAAVFVVSNFHDSVKDIYKTIEVVMSEL